MRVLQIASQAGPLHLFMPPLNKALRAAGAEVEFACMPIGALWEPLCRSESKVHSLPAGRWSNPVTWWRLYRAVRSLLKSSRFDVMIVHTPAMSWIARCAARDLVPAKIYFAHGLPFAPGQSRLVHFLFRQIEKFCARYTDAALVVNSDDARTAETVRLTTKNGGVYQVPGPGVVLENFSIKPEPSEIDRIEKKFGLRSGNQMVLFLGRFLKTKRPEDVLELARRVGPNVDFIMAGEGPLWKKTRAQAQTIGQHVKVIEFTHDIPLLLARCSLLVLPSVYREGLPQILLECGSAAKPAVAYDIRGVRDIIVDNETGFLVPPADVNEFCRAVQRLLEDPDLAAKMGAAAQERMREKFAVRPALAAIWPAIAEVLRRKGVADLPAEVPNFEA